MPELETWREHFRQQASMAPIDLYCHIPFCQSLCHYCGCNRIITNARHKSENYLQILLHEIALYRQLAPLPTIAQIHLGGGTPTYLSAPQLQQLLSTLNDWNAGKSFYGSIEVDPRVTTSEQLLVLWNGGFRKLSLGIQDFDPVVQKAIHRQQPFELVQEFLAMAFAIGNWEINFDLIYGLPEQTANSIRQTIEQSLQLSPHSIAFFSYAHVPWKMPHQKSLERFNLPDDNQRLELFEVGKELLINAGYKHLGLDHFCREGSTLLDAYYQKKLARNFMGHVITPSPVLLGLGASAISSTPDFYVQNEKEVEYYSAIIHADVLPLSSGHSLTDDDKILGKVIHDWLCYQKADIVKLLTIPDSYVQEQLHLLAKNNLIEISGAIATIPEHTRHLVRWICSQLDWRLKSNNTTLSRL
jgi:oxygen-independent coproporphyrinogen III oxidase